MHYTVVQLHQAVREALSGVQIQGHVTVTPSYQWNAVSNKHRDNADDELIDRLLVKKRGDEIAPTHQPEILPGEFS